MTVETDTSYTISRDSTGSAVLRGDLSKHATDTVSEAGQVIRGGCDEHIKVDGPVAPCTIRFRILTGAIHATPG